MNVFEDLNEELRDENLLEQTIIDLTGGASVSKANGAVSATGAALGQTTTVSNGSATKAESDVSFAKAENDDEERGDFYRKRAMDEVSSLQMVDLVLSGIER